VALGKNAFRLRLIASHEMPDHEHRVGDAQAQRPLIDAAMRSESSPSTRLSAAACAAASGPAARERARFERRNLLQCAAFRTADRHANPSAGCWPARGGCDANRLLLLMCAAPLTPRDRYLARSRPLPAPAHGPFLESRESLLG